MKQKKIAAKSLLYLSLFILIVLIGFPMLQMVSMAFKGPQEQFSFPITIFPKHWTLENFRAAIGYQEFRVYFANSLLVSSITTVLTMFVSVFGAYGFTRTDFPGRRFFRKLILFGQMICLASIAIPVYKIIGNLGLINSYSGLIICYLTFSVPVAVWLLCGFIQDLPKDIEEAAMIDGTSRLGAFFRVVIPLLRPGLGASAAYVFFLSWQEFLFALIVMTDKSKRTLPPGIMDYVGQYETNWGSLMASSILLALPVFVLFIFIQKQLISGLTAGAVKG